MDELSVRTGFNITPEMDGSFTWDDRVLYYHPIENWTEGVEYNVTFAQTIIDIWDRRMSEAVSYNFTVPTEIPGDDDDDDDTNETDTDGDGIPDWWEDLYGLNKTDPSDAASDSDNDTYSNLDEFLGGTDPTDPEDFPESGDGEDDGGGSGWWAFALIALLVILLVTIILIFVIAKMVAGKGEEDEADWEE
jgi:hypothetical protein